MSTCIEYVSLCFPVSFLFVSFAFAAKKGFLPNYLRVRRMCLLYLPNRKVQSAAFLLKALGDTLRRIVRRASCSLLPPWGLLTMAPYDASEDLVLHRGAACFVDPSLHPEQTPPFWSAEFVSCGFCFLFCAVQRKWLHPSKQCTFLMSTSDVYLLTGCWQAQSLRTGVPSLFSQHVLPIMQII